MSLSDSPTVLAERRKHLGVLTLNRPQALNALSLEMIFGVLWVWLFAGEAPGSSALVGGAIVVSALVFNELLSLRGRGTTRTP